MSKAIIEREVKALLKKFGKELEGAASSARGGVKKEVVGGFRTEGAGVTGNTEFKERMLANAPRKNKDSILAEKGSWQ